MNMAAAMSNEALKEELLAFDRDFNDLATHYMYKFVVYKGSERIGAFDTFDTAAQTALERFGLGPYLIRQVIPERKPMPMPASVAYRPIYGQA